MIPPRFMAINRLVRSAWAAGTVATLLGMAAQWLDLLLHGAGVD